MPGMRAVLAIIIFCGSIHVNAERYLTQEEFLRTAFMPDSFSMKQLWLDAAHKKIALDILGHEYRPLRVRYWKQKQKTAWMLDEIGKEQPITLGIVINAGKIETLQVIEYREMRGGEIRHRFFTEQFRTSSLTPDLQLSRTVDTISGASLSVSAATKVSRLALYFHSAVCPQQENLPTDQLQRSLEKGKAKK